jgi:hypothetical protein
MKGKSMKCTDAAREMPENKGRLQALIKRSAAEAVWTRRMIGRESRSELSEVMNTVIKTVNYIKIRPLRSTHFA